MKRKHSIIFGNSLMGIGLIGMVGGILLSVMSYSPDLGVSYAHGQFAIAAIFLGAFVWLIGARIGGFEKIEDRYWQIRYFGKRSHR